MFSWDNVEMRLQRMTGQDENILSLTIPLYFSFIGSLRFHSV